ncbi:MAG: ABC transporter ATP-binding protein [Cyanobacteria bacterium P01_H01_bin.121]
MLSAYDLWKLYNDTPVVAGVEFTLNAQEVLGLLGPNGAGKTTIVGMLHGSVIPTRGFVQFQQWQLPRHGREARREMGIVTQEDNLDPDFRVLENLSYFAHHYGLTGAAARRRAEELLDVVNLRSAASYEVEALSGGMKRRLVLARALINQPKLIFLDEPTTGLDPDARQDFWRLVTYLRQQGCGVLLTTHYMDEAQRLCDRLLLLQQGKIIDQGTPADLIKRTVGSEIIEIQGPSEADLRALVAQHESWLRSFGDGYLVSLPSSHSEPFWQQLQALQPERLTRRSANLEDVFLKLTGSTLD